MTISSRNPIGLSFMLGLFVLFAVPFSASAGGVSFQTAEVTELSTRDGTGAATLTRQGRSVHVRVALAGLDPYSVYSVWFIVWNRPHKCGSPNPVGGSCTPPPGGGDAPDAVRNAAGFVTGEDGVANFSAWLDAGREVHGLPGFGRLTRTLRSEIHVVIQSHGEPLQGSVAGQISTPGFACNPDCSDQFGYVFPPVNPAED